MSGESNSDLNQKDQEAQDINPEVTGNVSDQKSDSGSKEPKILPETENPDNQIDQNVQDSQPQDPNVGQEPKNEVLDAEDPKPIVLENLSGVDGQEILPEVTKRVDEESPKVVDGETP